MIRIRTFAALLAAGAIAATAIAGAAASGPNLITNGSFDAGLNGWSLWSGIPGTLSWNAGDHSLSVTNTSDPASTTLASAEQCVSGISAGQAYTLNADAFVPSGQKRHGGAHARVYWFTGTSCNGSNLSAPFASKFITSFDAWTNNNDTFVAPAGAKSVNILLGVEQYKADPGEDPAAHFTAKWDNAKFTLNELPPPVTKTATATATASPTVPPIVTVIPTTTATATSTPIVIPSQTVTPPTSTPTGQPTDQPTTLPTNQPQNGATPSATTTPDSNGNGSQGQDDPQSNGDANGTPASSTSQPLPPNTGSGSGFGDSMSGNGSAAFELFAAGLGIIALGGLAFSIAQVVRRD